MLKVGNMNTCLLFNNTALRMFRAWFSVLAYDVDAFYDGTVLLCDNLKHFTGLTFVITGVYIDDVAFLDM